MALQATLGSLLAGGHIGRRNGRGEIGQLLDRRFGRSRAFLSGLIEATLRMSRM